MLDIDKLKKDINDIYDKYPYKKGKKPLNINILDKDIISYIKSIQEELNELEFIERCEEMNKIYKIIYDLKYKKFGI
jgi:hypothetical protein